MPRTLPDDWLDGTRNTLNVREDLGLNKLGVPANLRIKRNKGKTTQNLFAEYLPAEEDDARKDAGRSKGGKRMTIQASMRTPDAFEAGRRAIAWVLENHRVAKAVREQEDEQKATKEAEEEWKINNGNTNKKRIQINLLDIIV